MENFQYAENLFAAIVEALNNTEVDSPKFWTDGEKILSKDQTLLNAVADLIDGVAGYGVCCTGYYDPEEDERTNCTDEYTGNYYVELAE